MLSGEEVRDRLSAMPRYHLRIRNTSLSAVEKDLAVTLKQDGSDVLVELHAPNPPAATNAVVPRLPKGHPPVGPPTQVP